MTEEEPAEMPSGNAIEFRPRFNRLVGPMESIPIDLSAFPVVTAIPAGGRLTITLKESEDSKDWGTGRKTTRRTRSRRNRRPRRRRPSR